MAAGIRLKGQVKQNAENEKGRGGGYGTEASDVEMGGVMCEQTCKVFSQNSRARQNFDRCSANSKQ